MLGAVAAQSGGSIMMIVWIVILFAFMYFFMIRPQQKETKKKNAMMSSLAVGDTVMTTSGFYGVIIDIQEDTVIVEFGSNRNCRIPMQKAAIQAVEKPEDAVESKKEKEKIKKTENKGLTFSGKSHIIISILMAKAPQRRYICGAFAFFVT